MSEMAIILVDNSYLYQYLGHPVLVEKKSHGSNTTIYTITSDGYTSRCLVTFGADRMIQFKCSGGYHDTLHLHYDGEIIFSPDGVPVATWSTVFPRPPKGDEANP
jgi:hypothetical protein